MNGKVTGAISQAYGTKELKNNLVFKVLMMVFFGCRLKIFANNIVILLVPIPMKTTNTVNVR